MSTSRDRMHSGQMGSPERLWTPAMPAPFYRSFEPVDQAAARVLWAVWCVPARYRLTARLWRQEARLQTGVGLRAKLRRLELGGLIKSRDVTGPGLVFDGQQWRRAASNRQGQFVALRLTATGEALVRRALAELD